jgi:hypothetical protein
MNTDDSKSADSLFYYLCSSVFICGSFFLALST